jgi:hypothetical protein
MDALKFRDLRTFVDHAAAQVRNGYRSGIEARLVGVNKQFFDPKSRQGNQLSAARSGSARRRTGSAAPCSTWSGSAATIRSCRARPAVLLARDRGDWAIERYELTLGDAGQAGPHQEPAGARDREDPAEVGQGAHRRAQRRGRVDLRLCGLRHQDVPRSGPLRKAAAAASAMGFEQATARPGRRAHAAMLDAEAHLRHHGGRRQEARRDVRRPRRRRSPGDATFQDGPIIPNVAGKVSATRELHFKDAESWLAYNKAFGRFRRPTAGSTTCARRPTTTA